MTVSEIDTFPVEMRDAVYDAIKAGVVDPLDGLWGLISMPAHLLREAPTRGYCKNGHLINEENVRYSKEGWIRCRVCSRAYKKTHEARQRDLARKRAARAAA